MKVGTLVRDKEYQELIGIVVSVEKDFYGGSANGRSSMDRVYVRWMKHAPAYSGTKTSYEPSTTLEVLSESR